MAKVKLNIPHTSQRGNFYPRGIYEETELPKEFLNSPYISKVFEEIDTGLKENIVEVKKVTRLEAENKGLVEPKPLAERIENPVADKIEERTPKIEKVNHNPKTELPEPKVVTLEGVLDKELDKEVTTKPFKKINKVV